MTSSVSQLKSCGNWMNNSSSVTFGSMNFLPSDSIPSSPCLSTQKSCCSKGSFFSNERFFSASRCACRRRLSRAPLHSQILHNSAALFQSFLHTNFVCGVRAHSAMDAREATSGISRPPARRKVIIDTDPGIDDMMAIFMAFEAPEIEVIGLTTIFGNVDTELATMNALHLCEMAGFLDIPVAEGPSESLQHVKPRIAYFVHGSDGLGETHQAKPKGQKSKVSAADFLVEKVAEFPGEVTVVALGPLTNIALAIQKDADFVKNVGQLVVLGGAFNACGNVNPAAEANIFCDPEAADIVFTAGLNTLAIGINLTTQVVFSEQDLCEIRDSGGKYGQYVYDCCRFYHKWHIDSDRFDGIFLHDPTCMAALINPSLFTFRKGAVRVETLGQCVGHTLLDYGLKNWVGNNPWTGVPPIDVGITVDVDGVRNLVKKCLCSKS